jgi:hypothetical protein
MTLMITINLVLKDETATYVQEKAQQLEITPHEFITSIINQEQVMEIPDESLVESRFYASLEETQSTAPCNKPSREQRTLHT